MLKTNKGPSFKDIKHLDFPVNSSVSEISALQFKFNLSFQHQNLLIPQKQDVTVCSVFLTHFYS